MTPETYFPKNNHNGNHNGALPCETVNPPQVEIKHKEDRHINRRYQRRQQPPETQKRGNGSA